jgi:hypothetical protein
MKLLYYIPAFGEKDIELKYNILTHNLDYIYNIINEKFDICINFYTVSDNIKNKLKSIHFIDNLYIYEKEGVLTELFLTNPNNAHIPNYDYILFALDDVKIQTIDLKNMIEIKEKYKIEILSPKIVKSTWKFMNKFTDLTINNFMEVYLMLLTPADFTKFCSINTVNNKWMWGVDFLFGFYNIKVGVLHTCIAEHILPSKSKHIEAQKLMAEYLKTQTKYTNLNQIKKDFPEIVETITL